MTKLGVLITVVLGLLTTAALIGLAILYYQGRRQPTGTPEYVAMGSSFAAGLGLGQRAPDSPLACMRSVNGYPRLLSQRLTLTLVDVTCSGATTGHILRGGQYFQRAQLDAVDHRTKLVTITSGGNDIQYVGDITKIAARQSSSALGWLARRFTGHPLNISDRDFAGVSRDLVAVVGQIRRRAPDAEVVLVTYPVILPPAGTCARLNMTAEQVAAMRTVGDRLAAATRDAAMKSQALLVDMALLSANHHACSEEPWVNGWNNADGTQFHPTLAGAQATAAAIAATLQGRVGASQ